MSRARGLLVAAAALGLVACAEHHYIVRAESVPLYGSPDGDDVVATLPRYHHEPLDDDPEDDEAPGRWRVTYRGEEGWVPRQGVRTFDYLDPAWDGGDEKRAVVGRELREAQLDVVGRDWPAGQRAAVRAARVEPGMTRQQVELAWGWPTTVEGLATGDRWVWREAGTRREHRWVEPYPTWGLYGGWRGTGWPGCPDDLWWTAGGGWRGAWVTVDVPVVHEKVVEFDPETGLVRAADERTLLDDAP
jgi:outer membrane protein assembly factor BamE (lipoprotein component of BamABCDE complex)